MQTLSSSASVLNSFALLLSRSKRQTDDETFYTLHERAGNRYRKTLDGSYGRRIRSGYPYACLGRSGTRTGFSCRHAKLHGHGFQNMELTKQIATIFNSRLIRFYYGRDLLGIEIGAAAKMSLASLPVCSMATITAALKELSWPGELTKFPNSSLLWEVPI